MNLVQPLWYHPTTLMLVDDDKKLLKFLTMEIDSHFPTVTFSNPTEALEYLKKHVLPLEELSNEIVSEVQPMNMKQLMGETVAIRFSSLHAHLDNPTRFIRTVTLLVDKVMKEMDGLDFCREVRKLGLPVKLILLTGNMGEREAIDAFNHHTIDAFVVKSGEIETMMSEINRHINTLAFKEFCEISAKILGPIQPLYPLLSKSEFHDFIKKHCPENTVEIYIIDASGTCLCITKAGKAFILLIKTDEDFINAYDIADTGSSQPRNADVLRALKEKISFPFTGTEESYLTLDSEKWKVMVPMKKNKDLNFYYALVEIPKKVLSFDHYVKEIWKPVT